MTCQFCNVTHKTTVPTVHLNGTPAKSLFDGLQATLEALHEAQRRMAEAGPNGRDYYPQGPQAMTAVMEQHEQRHLDLNRMMRELEEMRDHVQAVLDFQETNRRR
jgi:hypothetical protein